MTADVELLPLPGVLPFSAAGARKALQDWCRANVAHATAAKDAEIEALKSDLGDYMDAANYQATRAERLAEALRLIAAPMRSDGSWNRDREACRQIARDALIGHVQEVDNG